MLLFERWQAAGNAASLSVYPEAPHGFNHLKTKMAAAGNDEVASFLKSRLALGRSSGKRASENIAS